MNNKTLNICIAIAAVVVAGIVGWVGYSVGSMNWNKKVATEVMTQVETMNEEKVAGLDEWGILQLAIAKTESDFDFFARGNKGDLGLFQATEIWVEDVNRILGDEVYSHTDALDPQKSIEMFKVIQDNYNPNHEVARAINLHNPKGDAIGYSIKVRQNIEWVKRYETVRKMVTN